MIIAPLKKRKYDRKGKEVNNMKKFTIIFALAGLLISAGAGHALAASGAQVFDIYDNTNDGLIVGTDPDTGNVEFVANPGGQARVIIQTHLQKAAPNCTYSVELVRDSAATNGGLDATGHTGSVEVLGTLTTNKAGNGNAHFDVEVGDGTLDTEVYGHLDFEVAAGSTCTEADGTDVTVNEYGAAPDPVLATPVTWME